MCSENSTTAVLFVCFGNTCRSPMAEAIFTDLVQKRNVRSRFIIDSAAISDWQQGCSVNPKVDVILKRIGITNFSHHARPLSYKDYENFDYMLGMDYFHINDMSTAAEALKSKAEIQLLGEYNPNKNDKVISDPFGKCMAEFEKCYEQISVCCERLLEKLLQKSDKLINKEFF